MDHSSIQRWVVHYAPCIEKAFRRNKKRTGLRWRMDETYLKIKGRWKYLYRAVEKKGNTIDFLLTAKRDKKAARRFLNKAIGSSGKLSLINIDKSGANTAAIRQYNTDANKRIRIRQCKYLKCIVEQDHRFIKRRTRPMLDFIQIVLVCTGDIGGHRALAHAEERSEQKLIASLATVLRLAATG